MTYKTLCMPGKGDTSLVAMSGGVDSTYTAVMLHEAGVKVAGVTMAIWDGEGVRGGEERRVKHPSCYSSSEAKDIMEVKDFCNRLGIKHYVIDLKEEYRRLVIEYFKEEYRLGRTPNPCIRCNRELKFGLMRSGVKKMGDEYEYFCTGHYANVVRPDSGIWDSDKRPALVSRAIDGSKDQSYFLCNIPSAVLESVRFPLGMMRKEEVKKAAREAGIKAADKEESQDFMAREERKALFCGMASTAGEIIDSGGKVLGRHSGIEQYTIGQRRGLGISSPIPLYVKEVDALNNTVTVCTASELEGKVLTAKDALWPLDIVPKTAFTAEVKIRLKGPSIPANVTPQDTSFTVRFKEGARAIARGQEAVIYIDGVVYGAGTIEKPR